MALHFDINPFDIMSSSFSNRNARTHRNSILLAKSHNGKRPKNTHVTKRRAEAEDNRHPEQEKENFAYSRQDFIGIV